MKGAIAEPSVSIIKTPRSSRMIIIGASHHFFLSFKKLQSSKSIDILDIPLNLLPQDQGLPEMINNSYNRLRVIIKIQHQNCFS